MSIAGFHAYLTSYIRDPAFRERVAAGITDDLLASLGIDAEEAELVRRIDLDALNRAAVGLAVERRDRRANEFPVFTRHLARWTDSDAFWAAFDRGYPTGMQARALEMQRLVAHAAEWIAVHRLPEYLVDLLRFDYHTATVGESPRVQAPGARTDVAGLLPSDRVALREPYTVQAFAYDPVALAQVPPEAVDGPHWRSPTTLLIQKDWEQPKTSRVLSADAVPPVGSEPVLVLDLVAGDSDAMIRRMARLEELHRQGVLHVFRAI